jgi:hypothetical protein
MIEIEREMQHKGRGVLAILQDFVVTIVANKTPVVVLGV